VVAAVAAEIFNSIIRCIKWQKYQINHKKYLFL
jgi:hypothetical protein